jgi:hypothetical protein
MISMVQPLTWGQMPWAVATVPPTTLPATVSVEAAPVRLMPTGEVPRVPPVTLPPTEMVQATSARMPAAEPLAPPVTSPVIVMMWADPEDA